jgi:hypothetical protein
VKIKYSEKEIKLFNSLGYNDLLAHIEPYVLYRMAVEKVFLDNLSGPNIEALRRAAKSMLVDGKPYRFTPEFEKLLEW